MHKPGGYAITYGLWGEKSEWETFTCHHCNVVVKVLPKCDPYDLGGMCRLCMKMVCPKCVDKGVCDPIEKKLERLEARDRALRSYGI